MGGGKGGAGGSVDTFCIQVRKCSRLSYHLKLTACQVAFPRGHEDRRERGALGSAREEPVAAAQV